MAEAPPDSSEPVPRVAPSGPALLPAPLAARFAAPFPRPAMPPKPINYCSLLRALQARTHADLRDCRRCLNYYGYDLETAARALVRVTRAAAPIPA
jgi:hypothetical protein